MCASPTLWELIWQCSIFLPNVDQRSYDPLVPFSCYYFHNLWILEPERVEPEWERPQVWGFENLQSDQFVIKCSPRNNFEGDDIVLQKKLALHKKFVKFRCNVVRTKSLIWPSKFSFDRVYVHHAPFCYEVLHSFSEWVSNYTPPSFFFVV